MIKCLVLLCLATAVLGRSASSDLNSLSSDTDKPQYISEVPKSSESTTGESSIWSDFDFIYKTYQKCSTSDLSVCLKLKLVRVLDNAARSMKNLELMQGVKFVRLDKDETNSLATLPSEEELLNSLPRSTEGKESALSSLLWDRVSSFFQSHTLQMRNPLAATSDDDEDQHRTMSADVEGRKKKKGDGYIMIPLVLGAIVAPLAYGALALLAGKALIVSKLALVLASIIGIKKLLSGGHGHHESSHEVVVGDSHSRNGVVPSGGSGWGRDFDLAYRHAAKEQRPTVKFPSAEELQRSMTESRKDKKGKGGFIMIPLLLGSTIIPIAYGALALLAGKALIVSKLALVLASIIGIKKLVSHSSSGHETSRVGLSTGNDRVGAGWGRDIDLAYSAHRR